MTPLLPVDVQRRADAELGAAFRRVEAALPEGQREVRFGLYDHPGTGPEPRYWADAWCVDWPGVNSLTRYGPTPTDALYALADALNALADALESREIAARG